MENIEGLLKTYLYGLEKCAARDSFVDFLENWGISEDEYNEIKKWFVEHGVTGYITK